MVWQKFQSEEREREIFQIKRKIGSSRENRYLDRLIDDRSTRFRRGYVDGM